MRNLSRHGLQHFFMGYVYMYRDHLIDNTWRQVPIMYTYGVIADAHILSCFDI